MAAQRKVSNEHVVISLSGPPRGKGRGRAVSTQRGTRVFTDDKTRTYESQLRFAGLQEMAGRAPSVHPIQVKVEARFQVAASWSRKKRVAALAGLIRPATTPDADNLLKILDALNGVVWVDDRQIVDATVHKIYSEFPGLTIIVDTIEAKITQSRSTRRQPTDLFGGAAA
jgi:Holliday junction resolvase RusA-like endonuclease